jgi:hypothetical protein
MAKQTFTAGQVLTAAQVNNLQTDIFNQTTSTKTANYTLLVGDRGTRLIGNGTSITFTVDNSIFTAGDTIKLHNINSTVLTIAAGAGVTINAAAGLTIAQYQEATLFATSASSFILFESTASSAQGLTLLNTTSFSGVASQALNNVFSATYRNYKILFDLTSNVSDTSIYMKLRVGGVNNSTNYNWAMPGITNAGAGADESAQSQTVGFVITYGDNVGNDGLSSASIDLFKPFLANNTTGHIVMSNVSFTSALRGNAGSLVHEETVSYDGVDFISSAGNISGSVSIYGYNK